MKTLTEYIVESINSNEIPEVQLENLKDLLKYKKENSDNTVILKNPPTNESYLLSTRHVFEEIAFICGYNYS